MLSRHDEEHWAAYNERQQGRQARPLCRELIQLAGPGEGRLALDLGCGAGIETAALLKAGWSVHAVDRDAAAAARLRASADKHELASLVVEVADLNDVQVLPAADLAYAGYSLPYVRPDRFQHLWGALRSCLQPGGWLGVDIFGDRDSWADEPGGTFLAHQEVRALFSGLRIESWNEEDENGPSYSGNKHWHVFSVIARVPGGNGG